MIVTPIADPEHGKLDAFESFQTAVRARCDALAVELLNLEVPLREVALYALQGGKRLRPILTEAVALAVNAPPPVASRIGVAIEYLHTASCVLDDLPCMDDAALRRDLPAVHRRFSEAQAVLVSVALVSRAYGLLLEMPGIDAEVARTMARLATQTVASAMAPGQALGMTPGRSLTAEEVRAINDRKTASLFGLIGQLVTLAAPVPAETAMRVSELTTLVGRAYQIIDDLADAEGEELSNFARVAGRERARAEARAAIERARSYAADLDSAAYPRMCIDELERMLDAVP